MSLMVTAHGAATGGARLSDTVLLLGIAAAIGAVYWAGVGRLRPDRAGGLGRSWRWRRWCFLAGLAVVVVALLPLVDPWVDASFPLHMSQHLILMFVAAPLLAAGASGLPLLLALPRRWRRRVAAVRGARPVRLVRTVTAIPALSLLVSSALMLVWHLPDLYTAALRDDNVHVVEHLSFLVSGGLLWFPLTTPGRALDGGSAVLYVFVSGFPTAVLGAILTLAPRPLYPAQTGTGPEALAAQQFAGVLMWLPSTFLAVLICAGLLLFWFRRMERIAPGDAPLPPAIPPPLPASPPAVVRRHVPVPVSREVPR